jgi:uncharacterized protein YrzB (UPF0473 family)
MSIEKFDGIKEEIASFKVMNDDGIEVECEVLFSFESEETGKNYIVYTDNTLDEDDNTRVFIACKVAGVRLIDNTLLGE